MIFWFLQSAFIGCINQLKTESFVLLQLIYKLNDTGKFTSNINGKQKNVELYTTTLFKVIYRTYE